MWSRRAVQPCPFVNGPSKNRGSYKAFGQQNRQEGGSITRSRVIQCEGSGTGSVTQDGIIFTRLSGHG